MSSARDRYPLYPNLHATVFRQWSLMCDEIDELNATLTRYRAEQARHDRRIDKAEAIRQAKL